MEISIAPRAGKLEDLSQSMRNQDIYEALLISFDVSNQDDLDF